MLWLAIMVIFQCRKKRFSYFLHYLNAPCKINKTSSAKFVRFGLTIFKNEKEFLKQLSLKVDVNCCKNHKIPSCP
jgi:hypothetical protein